MKRALETAFVQEYIVSINLLNSSVTILFFQMRKVKLREVKKLAQG